MSEKKGRRESAQAIASLKDLFMANLLPPERPLVPFHLRNVGHADASEHHLTWWFFEDALKSLYARFVHVLERGTRDTLVHFKGAVLKVVFELLCERPEQERLLLSVLANKLGDTERTVASKAAYYLTLLLERHLNMRAVVVKEIESFLHRPHVSPRAQYYAIIFLNQIVLDAKSVALSEHLIAIYFNMFAQLLGTKRRAAADGDAAGADKSSATHFGRSAVSSRMLSALLSGVNRAFPFSAQNSTMCVTPPCSPVQQLTCCL